MRLRPERAADREAVAAVHEAAFGRPDEARIPALVRETDAFVPSLSIVAEDEGRVVGHVLVSLTVLVTESGEERRVPLLGPVGVLPERQGEGIGSALVRAAVRTTDDLREPLVILEGDPRFYGRFGFRPASRLGIAPPTELADEVFMALALHAYDPELRGRIVYPPAFDEDSGL